MRRRYLGLSLCIVVTLFAACRPNTQVGNSSIITGFTPTAEASPSPSPTPSRTRPSASPSPSPTPSFHPEAIRHTIVVRNVGDGYQPQERVVYAGDRITFENLDPSSKHSMTEGPNQTAKNPRFDSGALEAGERQSWQVDLAPGTYYWHCSIVPYLQGGPLKVLERPE